VAHPLKRGLAVIGIAALAGFCAIGYFRPVGRPYPQVVRYTPKCAPIVQQYLHLHHTTFLTSDQWMNLMQRVDTCEHPDAPWWRAAYAHDSDDPVRASGSQNSVHAAPKAGD
jgi:hypothetical protein